MNTLPTPTERRPIHTREITTRGFLRVDGLFDIEAELIDAKAYTSTTIDGRVRAAGDALHHMHIRLTIDDSLTVRGAVATMPKTPFGECTPAAEPFAGLIGVRIGPGWRKQIDSVMGGVSGCTHLRELLGVMATVAYQTVPNFRQHERRLRGETLAQATVPSRQMGKCLGWDFDGPVIARIAPQFVGYRLAPTTKVRSED